MTDLSPSDLIVKAIGSNLMTDLSDWCRCTECGGTGKCSHCKGQSYEPHVVDKWHVCAQCDGNAACPRCKNTDGYDPDRVRRWCITHDEPPLAKAPDYCAIYRTTNKVPACEWGWVPRIGVLP